MRRVLSEEIVKTSFFGFPQLDLIYFHNPKVACSTIQFSLVAAANARDGVKKRIMPHRRGEGQFVNDIFDHPLFGSQELRGMTSFSVVRNPFMRILSGYLNKFVNRTPVWRRFATEHGFDPDAKENDVSFLDFLRIIDTECDETINVHFKPQYLNLMLPFSRPHFIGRLEKFSEVEEFLTERGVPKMERKGLVTNTSGRLQEFYTPEAEEIVARKFADDFRLFGYSPRLSQVRDLLEPQWPKESTDLLMQWLADGKFAVDQLDPVPKAYVQFCAESDRDKQLDIVRDIFAEDDNPKRLKNYARRARKNGDPALAKAVDARLQTLKDAWRERLDSQKTFVPADKKSAAARRAQRRQKLDSRRGGRVKVDA